MDDSSIGTAGMICTVGATNGRAAARVNRSAITSLDCSAISVVSYFAVFSLIGIRVKIGGRKGEKNQEVFHKRTKVVSLLLFAFILFSMGYGCFVVG